MLPTRDTYEELIRDFRWEIPERFNIGFAVSDAWAKRDPDRICLLHYHPDRPADTLTYAALRDRSNALANGLRSLGIGPGDRVALLLPQSFATVIAHVAIYKIGAVAVPLALLFGPDALGYRLTASGAKAVITNSAGAAKVSEIDDPLPESFDIISVDEGTRTAFFDPRFRSEVKISTGGACDDLNRRYQYPYSRIAHMRNRLSEQAVPKRDFALCASQV